jgi:hypothetical protein
MDENIDKLIKEVWHQTLSNQLMYYGKVSGSFEPFIGPRNKPKEYGMTVGQLIEKLKEFDLDRKIYAVDGEYGNYEIKVEEMDSYTPTGNKTEKCLVISEDF